MSETDGLATGFRLADQEYQLFCDLIHQVCSVSLGEAKRTFLESRLRKRMEVAGYQDVRAYYQMLTQGGERQEEIQHLLDSLLIGETSFFRNRPQFDLFGATVLPELIRKKREAGEQRLRFWSAGCSTGQEPYSIAMTLLEMVSISFPLQIQILASDLSLSALESARQGIYRADQVRDVGEVMLRRYFRRNGSQYEICEAVKKMVTFETHNLKSDIRRDGLDVIFCRNVMIYFTTEEQQQLVARLAGALAPGGYLFLGHAESMKGLSERFSMLHENKGIAWRLER